MWIRDAVHTGAPRPTVPRVDPRPSAPARADGVHPSAPGGQQLFGPPAARPVPPPPPPAPPPVPTSLAEARQRIYDDAIAAATPSRFHHLPPEDRADVLTYATERADQAVALFDDLNEVANPMSARELRHLGPEDEQQIRQQALEQAWQAYQILAVDGPPDRTPYRGTAVVDRALAQTEAFVAHAESLSPELREACLTRILAGTDGLEATLTGEIDRALGERFPTLQTLYGEQSVRFVEALREGIGGAAEAALVAASPLVDPLSSLERLQAQYEAVRRDAAVLARFAGVEAGLDAFGIDLGHDAGATDWTDEQREQVLGQAIRIENAFRAADREGLLARLGPGEAFDALFASRGDITLSLITERHGCNVESLPVIEAGAITCSSELIEYRSLTSDETWDGLANARQYHFAHEFGHALNSSLLGAYRGLEAEDRSPYQVIDDAVEGLPDPSQRDWDDPAWGLPTRESSGQLYQFPYQQNTTASNGEYFADAFANWANGTLLDNEAGRALADWMDRMAPEWIRVRLEASDLIEPAAVEAGESSGDAAEGGTGPGQP